MEWAAVIGEALNYIESHITEDISVRDVAESVHISPFYLHKGFTMLCGYSLMEYVRSRRLSLAGGELVAGSATVTELAMKYGYDSPDSFARAFSRFHGCSPSMVRREKTMIKVFAPLKLTISWKGGYIMDYRITKKECFTVLASAKEFAYENASQAVPAFWREHHDTGKGQVVRGMFGINMDLAMEGKKFEYLIADVYHPAVDIPEGFVVKTIPAFTWAVFPCRGALPGSMKDVDKKIFSQWLPALVEYEIAAGYCVEMYEDPGKYPQGVQDDRYYAEIWVPVKKKGSGQ